MAMIWAEEAEEAVCKVPFFVRRRVKKHVEEEAARSGSGIVLLEHVHSCRKQFLEGKAMEIKGFQIETCFGASGCENRAVESDRLVKELEALLAERNIGAFLRERVSGPLKMHHEFRITLSDCPNACSRPQIADIGIIGARRPSMSDQSCLACGECVQVCREGAIEFVKGSGVRSLNLEKCVQCGKCLDACPTGTLREGARGRRILVGGKLGRHPQLGKELKGIYPDEGVPAVVERCLEMYFRYSEEGERLGAILNRVGCQAIIHEASHR